jgi:hypothetical protein
LVTKTTALRMLRSSTVSAKTQHKQANQFGQSTVSFTSAGISKRNVLKKNPSITEKEYQKLSNETPTKVNFRKYKPHNWLKNRCRCWRTKKGNENYAETNLACCRNRICTWFICRRDQSAEEKKYNKDLSQGIIGEKKPKGLNPLFRYAFLIRLICPCLWSILVICFQEYISCAPVTRNATNNTKVSKYQSCGMEISGDAHATIGVILSFLISFRANQAFNRFAKASEGINAISNNIRDTIRQIMIWVDDDKCESWDKKKRLVGYLVAFAYATNAVLTERNTTLIMQTLGVLRERDSNSKLCPQKLLTTEEERKKETERKKKNAEINIGEKEQYVVQKKRIPYLLCQKDLEHIFSKDNDQCPARAVMMASICVVKLFREKKLSTDPCVIPNIDANLSSMLSHFGLLHGQKFHYPCFI